MVRQIAVELFLMVLAGVVLALIGPFGSFELPLGQRLLLWPLVIVSGYPVFRGLGAISCWLSESAKIPYALAAILALAVAALPVSLIVMRLWFRIPPDEAIAAPIFGALYLQVLIVGAIVHVVMYLLFRHRLAPSAYAEPDPIEPLPVGPAPAADSGAALPLPPGFGAIHALKGEDHYVRVIGERSEKLILIRMRDAIEQLGGTAGLRVHRSWWVAHGAAASVRRDGRAAVITLAGGREIPVARDMMPALRAAGWL